MATRDHTARFRAPVPTDGTSTASPDEPAQANAAWPKSLRLSTLDDVALAVFALARLRFDSERCRLAELRGQPVKPLSWPLSRTEMANLGTAMQCLREYARLLGRESQVNAPDGR